MKEQIDQKQVLSDVLNALEEDLGTGDITSLLISENKKIHAEIMTREPMVLSGTPWAECAFKQIDNNTRVDWLYQESDYLEANTVFCRITGFARSILSAERTGLNFIQLLSATSTQTKRYTTMLSGFKTQLLDTRKTIPGLRYAQKYAVRCGGGKNHRYGLFDAFLIKENHIASCGSITEAIKKARAIFPEKKLEIEVETLNELHEALSVNPDVIMLDNFNLKKVQSAIKMRADLNANHVQFEISGNITLENIREYAKQGIDYISTGAITKNIQAIDLTLLVI